jgi:hypothetical protein
LGRFGGAVVEDREAAGLQLAGDVDLFDQAADIRGVAPGAQADAGIAGDLGGPGAAELASSGNARPSLSSSRAEAGSGSRNPRTARNRR